MEKFKKAAALLTASAISLSITPVTFAEIPDNITEWIEDSYKNVLQSDTIGSNIKINRGIYYKFSCFFQFDNTRCFSGNLSTKYQL